jgi:hypothetical protein
MLNKRGPRLEPCGTPDNTEKGEEKVPKIRTNDLFSK